VLDGEVIEATAVTEPDAEPAAATESDAVPDEAWLDAAPVEPAEVDEDALAAALAEDELGDVTPAELAGLEAGLVLGDDPNSLDDGGQVR
jgi:hypothetical protein